MQNKLKNKYNRIGEKYEKKIGDEMIGNKIMHADPWAAFFAAPQLLWIWIVVGIVAAVVFISFAVYYLKDLSHRAMDDLPKVLWVIAFLLVPIISWIAYYIVVMKADK